MAVRSSKGVAAGQELLSFDGPPIVNRAGYDKQQAAEAARHRHKRKGELALTPRTRGFLGMVGSLWIPHSGTENAAVVAIPENYVHRNKQLIRDKVIEKYEDSDRSMQQIMLWAYFASHQVGNELREKFYRYGLDAEQGYLRINVGLGPNGEVERDRVEASDIAYRGVMSYLVYLQTFVGAPEILGKGEKRKWPQARHHKALARRMDWAQGHLEALPEYEFAETVKEAYYSERSRHVFWNMVRDEHTRYLKEMHHRQQIAMSSPLPIDAYLSDPRADDTNYVNDEYIG